MPRRPGTALSFDLVRSLHGTDIGTYNGTTDGQSEKHNAVHGLWGIIIQIG